MAPTVKFWAGEDGIVTDKFIKHYGLRAAHECGLIVVEATCVSSMPAGPPPITSTFFFSAAGSIFSP